MAMPGRLFGWMVMMLAGIFGVALLGGGFGAGLGCVLFGVPVDSNSVLPVFLLGCVGGIVGAIAGVGAGVVLVLRGGRGTAGEV